MREDLYRRRYEAGDSASQPFLKSHTRYKATLEQLYRQILKFQADCYCYYAQDKVSRVISDFAKKYDWDGLVEEIRQQEAQMAAVDKHWRDQQYDEECAAAENRYQGTILSLKAIGVDVAKLRRANSDRDQQEFLHWLCNIDPSNLYNAARGKHKGGTSEWLIKENQTFKSWIHNPCSLLWLHGKGAFSFSSNSCIYIASSMASVTYY